MVRHTADADVLDPPPSAVNPGQPTPWGPNNVFMQTVSPPATGDIIGTNGSGVTVNGTGLESAYVGIRPASAPAAPSSLSATAMGDGAVALLWIDNSSNEDGFDVERWDAVANNWARVATQVVADQLPVAGRVRHRARFQ